MPSSRVAEVLYDSETVLRLVDRELEELCEEAPTPGHPAAMLLALVQDANREIQQVLSTFRDTRAALQDTTVRELHSSVAKVADVMAATETAATSVMDAAERAQDLIERLDELSAPGCCEDDAATAAAIRARLREEIFSIVGALQFQDVTSQQLGHVRKMLVDVEHRIHASVAVLEGDCSGARAMDAEPRLSFAESASTVNSGERQAVADSLWLRFTRRVAS